MVQWGCRYLTPICYPASLPSAWVVGRALGSHWSSLSDGKKMPTTHHHPNMDTAGCLLKGNTPAAIFKSNSCFSVVLERTAPFLYSTGLATAGRNNELTDTCKMPLLHVYYLSLAPHYVHISSNRKLRQSLFVSFLTLLS